MTGTITPVDRSAVRSAPSPGRRSAPSREPGRWPRRVLGLLAVALVAAGAVGAVVLAPATSVERVDVAVAGGSDPELEQAVLAASQVRAGDPWLLVDPGAVRARIVAELDPASVRVRKEWPRLVTIDVAPARAVAALDVAGSDGPDVEVGPGGRVRGAPAADPSTGVPAGLPTLRVDPALLPAGIPPAGELLPEPLRSAVVLLEQLPSSLRGLLADARIDAGGALEFRLPPLAGRATVRFGPLERVPAKVGAAEAMLVGNVDLRCLSTLDVRRPDRPTIERSCEPGG